MKGAARNHKIDRIVVIGASFAAGWNPREIAGLTVINKGVGGEQSFEMLSRFDKDVTFLNPKAVIIWGFINDIFKSKREEIDGTMAKAGESFEEMVKMAQDNGIIPILAAELTIREKDSWTEPVARWVGGIPGKESYQNYVNEHVLAMNQWLREYAKAHDLLLLDLQAALSDRRGMRKKEYTTEDGMHISKKGYETLTFYARDVLVAHIKNY